MNSFLLYHIILWKYKLFLSSSEFVLHVFSVLTNLNVSVVLRCRLMPVIWSDRIINMQPTTIVDSYSFLHTRHSFHLGSKHVLFYLFHAEILRFWSLMLKSQYLA